MPVAVLAAFDRIRRALSPTAEAELSEDLSLVESTLMTATLSYDKSKAMLVPPSPPPAFDFDNPAGWAKWVFQTATPEQAICVLYNLMSTAFYKIPGGASCPHANFFSGLVFLIRHVPDVNVLVTSGNPKTVFFPLVAFSCIDASGMLTRELIARGARFHGYHPTLMPLDRMREFAFSIGYDPMSADTYPPIQEALAYISTLPLEMQETCTSL